MHKKYKIYNKTTQRNQQKTQLWQMTQHVVTSRIVECDGRIQLFKLRII